MTKCKKNIFNLKVILLLSYSLPILSHAATTTCTNDGTTQTCTGDNAIYMQGYLQNASGQLYTNVIINNTALRYTLANVQGIGLYANMSNLVANNLSVTTNGSLFPLFGGTDAIRTNGTSTITINGKLNVQAHGFSADGINVSITSNAIVSTGDNSEISADSGVAVRANLSQTEGANNRINIGESALVTTTGVGSNELDSRGYAIFAGSRNSGDSVLSKANTASVVVGENATIKTDGTDAYAVYANKTGYIQLGSGVDITTAGTGAHAIVAQDGSITANGTTQNYTGGVVDLLGNTKIRMSDTDAKAIYASGDGSIISSYNKDTATQTSGVFDVVGDMAVDNDGVIDLRMTDTSSFIGNTSIADSASTLNLNISGANSKWQMSQSSQVTDLNLASNANVILGDQSVAVNSTNRVILTAKNLEGNGLFSMRTDIIGSGLGASNTGDLLQVTGTSKGNHLVSISDFYNGSAAVDGSERLKIIETTDGGAKFALNNSGKYVDIGAYKYYLNTGDTKFGESTNDWHLTASKKDDKTNTADRSVSVLAINYLLNYAEMQTLLNRMSDLHKGRDKDWDFWIRGFTGKMNSFNSSVSNFDFTYHGFQLGIDRRFNLDGADLYTGIMAGKTKAKADYDIGHGDADSYHFGLYTTYKMDNDFYIDALAKYTVTKNDFNTETGAGQKVDGDTRTRGYTFGLETGKRFYFNTTKSGFYLEPQAQLTYSHQNGANVHSSNGLKTKLDDFDSLLGRASIVTGYNITQGTTPIDVYWKTGYLKEFKGKTNYTFNDNINTRTKYKFDGGWWENGVGITARINKVHNVYLEGDYASGSKFDNKSLRVGYRFEF